MRLQKTIPLLLIAVCAQFFLSCTSPINPSSHPQMEVL